MNKLLVTLISITVIALLAALGYFIFQNQQLIGQLSKNPVSVSPAPSPTPTPSASIQPSPSGQITALLTQNAIKTNIAAKNYQGLIPYMTDPVEIILQATECCGPQTAQEAVDQMSYIEDGVPFDFDQNTDSVKNLKAKNAELADKYIGISKSQEHLVAFGIDNSGRIADIRISVSWKLFSY